jgi:MoaA/NifB/PqqE/SkfB family radical SAM enzyme/Tfp pilus assembly protein PilF
MNTPEILHLQVTERCNLACPGCYLPDRTGRGAPASLIDEKVFKPLAEAGVRHVTLTGGEPLLHPEFVEICARARAVFDSVQVVTNGLLLDLAMFSRLRDAGVASIKVSLDGALPGTNDLLRGKKGAFEKTVGRLRSILALPESKRSGVELGSITTVHPGNVSELTAISGFVRDLGLKHFLVQPYHCFGPVYPPTGEQPLGTKPEPSFLKTLSQEVEALKTVKAENADFIDNSLEMLDKMVEFAVNPEGPRQRCGANRFVFVNSGLEARGCLFCLPLASLERSHPGDLFAGKAWEDFQKFRRGCRRCLMGCQFLGVAQRLSDRGFALTQGGRYPGAERLFKDSLEREYSVDAVHGLALAQWKQGRLEEAGTRYREVLRARPGHQFAGGDLCEVLRASGRMDEALEAGAWAVENASSSYYARYQHGLTLLAAGRAQEALEHLLHASRMSPNGAWIRFNLGMALFTLGRGEEALGCFREAVRLEPEVPWFHYRLGLTLAGQGSMDEALAEMHRAVELAPGEARPHLELGRLLRAAGQELEAADEHLRKAAEIDPALVPKEFPMGITHAP